jgi:MSHA pilin protein MshD
MNKLNKILNNRGVTLIELIVAMVVISIALTGVLLVINYTTLHSADPVLRHQAIAIAEAYMEEICLKNFSDPHGVAVVEPTRALLDNVADYNGWDDNGAAKDQNGNAIGDLGNYTVSVRVVQQPYGPDFVSTVPGLRIDVTVTDPAGESLTLTGFRANY